MDSRVLNHWKPSPQRQSHLLEVTGLSGAASLDPKILSSLWGLLSFNHVASVTFFAVWTLITTSHNINSP